MHTTHPGSRYDSPETETDGGIGKLGSHDRMKASATLAWHVADGFHEKLGRFQLRSPLKN